MITNNLVIAEKTKNRLVLNKPVFVGSAILDLSKLLMWEFWYDEMRVKYPSASLCYTDTDSLIYSITSETEPSFAGNAGSSFDTSDYPKDHADYSADNKKVIGKFKDEAKGVPIAEFVGLRPKLYSIRLDTDSFVIRGDKELKLETNKSKGTQKCIVKNHIRMKNYIDTLQTGNSMKHKQINFRTDSHQIYTSTSTKISLSAFDSKRYLTDSINSLAYGHCRINAHPSFTEAGLDVLPVIVKDIACKKKNIVENDEEQDYDPSWFDVGSDSIDQDYDSCSLDDL